MRRNHSLVLMSQTFGGWMVWGMNKRPSPAVVLFSGGVYTQQTRYNYLHYKSECLFPSVCSQIVLPFSVAPGDQGFYVFPRKLLHWLPALKSIPNPKNSLLTRLFTFIFFLRSSSVDQVANYLRVNLRMVTSK